ncbi:LacI family DNA-binding transcriptional regulator [Phototrophicus methaneseepsis]|uniref:LacI family DNA-binding transcriptional regulator n=1 Tax=Phototrophicus methaneseepsis TaxID=2710758 RepID=A0A7S8IGX9_9CHLR|nr:LacI family DNA-binding transcriptional regulator [Phototrophicus methaneseepsis]QPC84598.1 LacI family DNA-binding transcriptional regulator [Phototrophicus methaneseepsis]
MKKRTFVTQKQIAKEAGVSQTLVSFVLNGSTEIAISDDTRQRVLDVAKELGYVPQAAAKSLVHGRSNNIGLVLVNPHYQVFRDPYIPNIITGLSNVVRSSDYRLMVEHINDYNGIMTIRHMLKSGEVAGIVMTNFQMAEQVAGPLIKEEYPIVLLEKPEGILAPAPSVGIDHFSGIRCATQHIISLGHERIACIAYGTPRDVHLHKRIKAFRDTITQAGLTFEDRYLRFGHYEPERGYLAMQSLLEETPRVTAVFGMNDLMALGAIRAILDAGLRVPEDIAVVGYDDMRFAEFINPALTTVRAPEVEQGQIAGKMLIDIIENNPISELQVMLETQLMLRASCGAA